MPSNSFALTFLAMLALGALAPAPLHAQSGTATLVARVVDDEARPLQGAGVWVGARSAVTDANGIARLERIEPGIHFVRVRADGYQAESIQLEFVADAQVDIEAQLAVFADVIALPPISVAAERQVPHLRRAGYYTRRQSGFGTFLEREDSQKWDHLPDVTYLLRGVRGLTVVWERSGYVVRSSRGAIGIGQRSTGYGARGCIPQIVVDGMPWSASDLGMVPASDVEAIEVYAGPATSPPQFAFGGNGTSCGTIVIWRRRGGRS
jgi:hypothetical protein